MPTLQAVDLNNLESVADASAQLSQGSEFTYPAGKRQSTHHKNRLRGYFALASLFTITGSGYAGLFMIFDHLVTLANG